METEDTHRDPAAAPPSPRVLGAAAAAKQAIRDLEQTKCVLSELVRRAEDAGRAYAPPDAA